MAYDKALADRVRDIMDDRPYVYEKTMFGGPCWFAHGNMAAAVLSGGGAMVRVGKDDFADLILEPGAEPMVMGGRESKTWLRVDEEACSSDERLREWVERGIAYAESLPRKSLPRRRQRQPLERPCGEERGGSAAVPRRGAAGGLQEALDPGDLAVEVPGVDLGLPDDPVDPSQLGDGAFGVAEGGRVRRVLELPAGVVGGVRGSARGTSLEGSPGPS